MAEAAARARLPELAKYEVLEEIGHGGMATVYRALDKRLAREVAVKLIHPHLRDSPEVVARFNTEAKAVAKLHHPNIVEVFDVSDPDEVDQYLVVELIRGTTLRKLLQARGAMPPEVAAAMALDLLAAVAHAHASGVIHRDIKPENVLVEHRRLADGSEGGASGEERVVVKLTDFGIAKLLDVQGVTSTGQVLGSPAHMAPEQIEGGEVDARSDTFGIGVLLYECMVGHLPFEGNNPAQVLRRVLDGLYPEAQREKPAVGSRWSALLDRALAHAPEGRFADAAAMRGAILAELDRLAVTTPRNELEAWLDDPKAYEERFGERAAERLRTLGDDARKHGRPIDAASDWNRALALVPDDPKLLRLVAGMHRAETRAHLLRQAGKALALSACLGVAVFYVGKLVQARPHPASAPAKTSAPLPPPPPMPLPPRASSASVAATAAEPPRFARPPALPGGATGRGGERYGLADASGGKLVDRTMSLDLSPAMGVWVSVDAEPPRNVQTGDTLTLSSKPHELTFSCPVCTPVERPLPAGDKDEELRVVVPIRPATLVVDGPADRHYEIAEEPLVNVHAGANSVSIGGQFESVTVLQLETGARVPVRLEAGKEVRAGF